MVMSIYNWRFKEWPFAANENAQLIWVSSPEVASDGRKTVSAVFQNGKTIVVMKHRLGELTVLQVGNEYQDGKLQWNSCSGQKLTFRQGDMRLIGFRKASACLPSLFSCFSGNAQFNDDLCAEIVVHGSTFFIPCMEIIRATAGTASFLTNTLFSSSDLRDYSSTSIVGNTLDLVLNEEKPNKYPANALRNAIFRDYVNFIFCNELSDWWEGIRTRYLALSQRSSIVPVEAFFPNSPNLEITGYCSPYPHMLWGIQLRNLPDSGYDIIVHHSSFVNGKATNEVRKKTIHLSAPTQDSAAIDADETAASAGTNISLPNDVGRYATKPVIHRAHREDAEKATGVIAIRPRSGTLQGSMDSPLPGGRLPHLEVVSEEQEILDLPRNIVHIYKSLKLLETNGEISSLSIQSDNLDNLKYAVMSGKILSMPFMVFELEQTDDHALSTLLVRKCTDPVAASAVATRLLLVNRFQWNLTQVESRFPHSYLLRHRKGRTVYAEAALIAKHLKR